MRCTSFVLQFTSCARLLMHLLECCLHLGSCVQAIAPVKHVSMGTSLDHANHTSKLEPKLHGIVKEMDVHIKEGQGGAILAAAPC